MNKFELQDKIKEKWVTRGLISQLPVGFLSGLLSDVLNGVVIFLVLGLIVLAFCFSMYKSELASALMWNTNKKKEKENEKTISIRVSGFVMLPC